MDSGQLLHIDVVIDTFDTIDGKHFVWASSHPDRRYPVDPLLDADGEETDDPEEAVGGVVQLAPESFTTFLFGAHHHD